MVGLAWFASGLFMRDRRWLALACIAFCLLYLGVSGGRAAAVRAGTMSIIYLGGYVLARRADFVNSLGAAALFILWRHPWALGDPGVHLSFTAVLFISRLCHEWGVAAWGLAPGLEDGYWTRLRGAAWHLLRLAGFSLAAWAGVWPLTALYFNLFSLTSILVNVLVLPLLAPVLAGGIVAALLADLLAGVGLGGAGAWPAEVLFRLVDLIDGWTAVSVAVTTPQPEWVLAYYLAWLVYFNRRLLRGWGWNWAGAAGSAGAAICTVGIVWRLLWFEPPASDRLTLLPSRAGETVVIETASGQVALIGTFPRRGWDVAAYLHWRGLRHVDLVATVGEKEPDLSALREHLRVDQVGSLDELFERNTPGAANIDSADWRPFWPGVELNLSRDRSGRLVWWSIRQPGLSATVSTWCWSGQLKYRLEKRRPGWEAQVLSLRPRDRRQAAELSGWAPASRVLVAELDAAELPAGAPLSRREDWGALVGEKIAGIAEWHGYTHSGWRELKTRTEDRP